MGLETSVVPVLNKMMAQVHNWLPNYLESYIVPREARVIAANTVIPELANLYEICASVVIVLYSWIEMLVVVINTMRGCVVSTIAQV
jgi:hypothetical protein